MKWCGVLLAEALLCTPRFLGWVTGCHGDSVTKEACMVTIAMATGYFSFLGVCGLLRVHKAQSTKYVRS